MAISTKMSYLKRRDKLTTEDVAHRTGVPVGTLNKIFSGETTNPCLHTMERICQLFRMPLGYFLDDSIPEDCSLPAYAESRGMALLAAKELDLLLQYRQLDSQSRRCVDGLLAQYATNHPEPCTAQTQRLLPCYEPLARGEVGSFVDAWSVKTIRVDIDAVTRYADCAVTLISDELAPFYTVGTLLAVRRCDCGDQQMGVFVLNHEAHIRKLCRRRGEIHLVSLKIGQRDLCVAPSDTLYCVGIVLGEIRHFRYLE